MIPPEEPVDSQEPAGEISDRLLVYEYGLLPLNSKQAEKNAPPAWSRRGVICCRLRFEPAA